jgi:hypothetical protein
MGRTEPLLLPSDPLLSSSATVGNIERMATERGCRAEGGEVVNLADYRRRKQQDSGPAAPALRSAPAAPLFAPVWFGWVAFWPLA